MNEIVCLLNFIKRDFCNYHIREVNNCLEYKSPLFQFPISANFEDQINEKFKEFAKNIEYNSSDYRISVKTTPTLFIEEKVIKNLVAYSNGTVWLHLIKDVEEVNRILRFVSPKAELAKERDLKRLCGEGSLSRWSYIKKTMAFTPEEFGSKIRKLIETRHYTSATTSCVLGSFGVKYEERRSLGLRIESSGISAYSTIKDLFSQETDILKTIEDFLSSNSN